MNEQDIYSGIFGSGVGLSLAPRSNVSGVFLSGNGTQTVFPFSNTEPIVSNSPHSYDVIIHGVGQAPTDSYTVSVETNSITFTEAPPEGTRNIYIRIITQAVTEATTPTVTLGAELEATPGNDPVKAILGINGPINEPIQALLNRIAAITTAPAFTTVDSLRSYDGAAVVTELYIPQLAGLFAVDPLDTSSPDDGIYTIADINGRRWKRVVFGPKVAYGTAAPTSGSWVQGDTVINTAPVEAGLVTTNYVIDKWRCVTSGSPGIWVQLRALTGN